MTMQEDAKEKTIMFHSMKTEAEKCLEQSERMKEDVKKLESDLYKKVKDFPFLKTKFRGYEIITGSFPML